MLANAFNPMIHEITTSQSKAVPTQGIDLYGNRVRNCPTIWAEKKPNDRAGLIAMLLETTEALKEARRYLAGDAASVVYDETGEVQGRARDLLAALEAAQ